MGTAFATLSSSQDLTCEGFCFPGRGPLRLEIDQSLCSGSAFVALCCFGGILCSFHHAPETSSDKSAKRSEPSANRAVANKNMLEPFLESLEIESLCPKERVV